MKKNHGRLGKMTNNPKLTRKEVLKLFVGLYDFRESESNLTEEQSKTLLHAMDILNTAQRERMIAEEDFLHDYHRG
jgi:hypothetical protein